MGLINKILKLKVLSFGAILLILTLIVSVIFVRSNPQIKKKPVLWYTFGLAVLYALFTIWIWLNFDSKLNGFIAMQVVSFILGSVHCYLMYILFKWSSRDSFWTEFWFTLFLTMAAATIFVLTSVFFADKSGKFVDTTSHMYYLAMIPFLVPYLALKCADFLWVVPDLQYKLWYFPDTDEIPDPLQYDLSDHMKVIAIELQPLEDGEARNIKVKAPERMELGHYFMSFVDQYNQRNREQPVEVMDGEGSPHGWLFALKTPWYKSSRIFDAESTINDNGIKENDIIVATRVKY